MEEQSIKELWNRLKSKEDLLYLLNQAKSALYEDGYAISLKQLNYYLYSKKSHYSEFEIPKKNGKTRTIDAPNRGLKMIQMCLNYIFNDIYTPHAAAMGFVPKRSIVKNAQIHVGQNFVYNIDLKDFFPSISAGRVYKRLMSKPFSLSPEMASMITDLCCYKNKEGKSVLPQGAPTSPTITNIICERLDRKLSKLAQQLDLKYSRYADDITFSGVNYKFAPKGKFCKALKHIIEEEEHFTINKDKTRTQGRSVRQEVTGLTVNEKVNVTKAYIKQVRTMIYNWETLGYNRAQNIFVLLYEPTKNTFGEHHIENIIEGKLNYLKMVKGEDCSVYRALKARFDALNASKSNNEGDSGDMVPEENLIEAHDISSLLDVWEKEGVEAAMKQFNENSDLAISITGEDAETVASSITEDFGEDEVDHITVDTLIKAGVIKGEVKKEKTERTEGKERKEKTEGKEKKEKTEGKEKTERTEGKVKKERTEGKVKKERTEEKEKKEKTEGKVKREKTEGKVKKERTEGKEKTERKKKTSHHKKGEDNQHKDT